MQQPLFHHTRNGIHAIIIEDAYKMGDSFGLVYRKSLITRVNFIYISTLNIIIITTYYVVDIQQSFVI